MTRPAHARFSPRLLELEPRDVPAGNVTATLFGDFLRVEGDAADNNVILRGKGPGVVEVQGVGTTINGGTAKLTFAGVGQLGVGAGAGNDTVTGRDLAILTVGVDGGAGDDTVRLHGTTGTEDGLQMAVWGDGDGEIPVPESNGTDTIEVTGTRVRGEFTSIYLQPDEYTGTFDTNPDTVTLSDTSVAPHGGDTGGFFQLSIDSSWAGGGPGGVGDVITIDRLEVDSAFPGSYPFEGVTAWNVYIFGSTGDDQIRVRNSDLSARSENSIMLGDIQVFGFDGTDSVELENTNLSIETPGGFNQVFTFLDGERVRVNNVSHQGGSWIEDIGLGTSGILAVSATEVELRNVTVTSATGFAFLNVFNPFDGGPTDDTITLANVTVRGGDAFPNMEDTFLYTGEGNDRVRITNADLGSIDIDLGEGDDTLAMVNVTLDAPYLGFGFGGIKTGGGGDTVSLVNCTAPTLLIDMGDGNDTLTLQNNTFGAFGADLGDGDDTARVHNNTAAIFLAIDGGDGNDTLLAWNNIAPDLFFDNFEL